MEKHPKRLLDQVRDAVRLKHYSIRTEEAYVSWIKRNNHQSLMPEGTKLIVKNH
jgi:hypothetical protein